MANTSATGGYLSPGSTAPLDDEALDRFFNGVISGVTGITSSLVRPRWQPDPPNMPARNTNWIAQGVTERKDDGVAWQEFDESTQIFTICRNQELINLVSFYGPNASATEALLRDGLSLDQNREYMNSQGIALVRVGDPKNAAMQINEQWTKRIDVQITFRRLISRTYPVLSLLAGAVQIQTDTGLIETINIT
ncbi:MAG: hypothetical protein H5T98_01045 [Syntrophomonadaceae bacterium]|nr:hypothetical protein [Syntrophomonadaceae bacterium]